MDEAAIVPYRASTLAKTEAVDLALIPDCGREEISRVKDTIDRVYTKIDAVRSAAFSKIFRKCLGYARGLLALVLATCMISGIASAYSIVVLTIAGFLGAYIPALVIASVKSDGNDHVGMPALLHEIHLLEARLEALKSREQLTGLGAQADKLASEAGKFNERLARLGDISCSQRERELIAEGRHRLLERIVRFRHEVMGESEAVPLLQLSESSTT